MLAQYEKPIVEKLLQGKRRRASVRERFRHEDIVKRGNAGKIDGEDGDEIDFYKIHEYVDNRPIDGLLLVYRSIFYIKTHTENKLFRCAFL